MDSSTSANRNRFFSPGSFTLATSAWTVIASPRRSAWIASVAPADSSKSLSMISWYSPYFRSAAPMELAPGAKAKKLDRALLKYDAGAIALVGHQPDLGEYAARLIGSKKASVDLAKPSLACIACEDPPGKGCGSL